MQGIAARSSYSAGSMASSASKPPRRRPGSDLDLPYIVGDTIPAPEVIEKTGDSAWALWSEVNRQHEVGFAKTAPASLPVRLGSEEPPGWAQTQPMKAAPRRPGQKARADAASIFTLEAAMLVARRNNRVCPRPERWLELYALLPERKTLRGSQSPPAPPTGPVWGVTAPLTKRLFFREHIEWAEAMGVLENVMAFMQTMPEQDWLHMGED
jgi:hypothetical protein